MGYFAEQSTKPQTLGYSLADSPVGVLAWIYEKLVAWTDSYPWSDDEGTTIGFVTQDTTNHTRHAVLTWVSIYWFSRAGPAASLRIYYELTKSHEAINLPKTTVPIGISFFPKENVRFPRACVSSFLPSFH